MFQKACCSKCRSSSSSSICELSAGTHHCRHFPNEISYPAFDDNLMMPAFLLGLWRNFMHCTRFHYEKFPARQQTKPECCGFDREERVSTECSQCNHEASPSLRCSCKDSPNENLSEGGDEYRYLCNWCGQKLYNYINPRINRRIFTHSVSHQYADDQKDVSGPWNPELDIVLPCPFLRNPYETTYGRSFRHPEVVAKETDRKKGKPHTNVYTMYHFEERDKTPGRSTLKSNPNWSDSLEGSPQQINTNRQSNYSATLNLPAEFETCPGKFHSNGLQSKISHKAQNLRHFKSLSSCQLETNPDAKFSKGHGSSCPYASKSIHSLHTSPDQNTPPSVEKTDPMYCKGTDSLCHLGLLQSPDSDTIYQLRGSSPEKLSFKNSLNSTNFPLLKHSYDCPEQFASPLKDGRPVSLRPSDRCSFLSANHNNSLMSPIRTRKHCTLERSACPFLDDPPVSLIPDAISSFSHVNHNSNFQKNKSCPERSACPFPDEMPVSLRLNDRCDFSPETHGPNLTFPFRKKKSSF